MIKFIHLVPVLVVLSPVVQQEHICKIVLVYNAQTIIIVQDPFMPLHVQQIIEVKEDQDIWVIVQPQIAQKVSILIQDNATIAQQTRIKTILWIHMEITHAYSVPPIQKVQ